MTKTIEEAASEYYLNEVINGDTCDDKDGWTDCFVSGADALMQLPLAQRMTAEEKERVRKIYQDYHQKWDCSCNDRESERSFYCFSLLERIFGSDFFKEGE